MPSVGTNIPHDSARGHVSGESVYIDDMPPARGELLVDFVWPPVPPGRIRAIDLAAARRLDGVVALLTHRDLHHNRFGAIIQDELLLAEDEVTFIGQPIVVVAAETRAALRAAKLAIELDIETLEPVFTIDEARRREQFIGSTMHIVRGDVDSAFASARHILEGTFANGGQDHFYLEGQAAIAVPGEFDQLVVHSSTQNPSEVQHVIAHLLGLQINQVTVVTKRMGGGFGGKECQATHPAAMAALDVRMRNCYGIGERNTTPYGQTVANNTLPRLFREILASSDYRARREAIDELNATSPTRLRGLACSAVKFGISFNTKFLNQA